MIRIGLMLRTPSSTFSTAEDVVCDQAKAFKKFGVSDAVFCEPHGIWLSLLDDFILGGRLVEVYAPDVTGGERGGRGMMRLREALGEIAIVAIGGILIALLALSLANGMGGQWTVALP